MSGLVLLSVLFLLLQHPLPSLSNSEGMNLCSFFSQFSLDKTNAFRLCVSIILSFVGDALYAFKQRLFDPDKVLNSWDPTLADPCTWFHVTCDSNNHVIRV